ncbi:MAG: DivIVA domain-containing protein, partial [Collinsella sp.]
MAITPADIQAQTFSEAKRGYDPAEVDVFLETLSSEVDAMLAKIVDLKGRLTATEQQLADTQAQLAQAQDAAAQAVPAAPVAAPAPDFSAQERQISAALIAAQQTAEGIVNDANENADRIRNEADAKAREVIRQALTEKQAELEEIDRLKASREEFKAEYLKLIQHFMDDA